MRVKNPRLFTLKFTAIGCALLAMGHFGCNQDASTVSPETVTEPAARPSTPQSSSENPILLKERELAGEELQTFLKAMPKDLSLEVKSQTANPSGGVAKSAAYPACLIDFASTSGLSYMADHAYTGYATSPYYFQPCMPQNAFVTPSGASYFWMGTEASGTCPGAYGKIGYGTPNVDPNVCRYQKDAALYPRYAGNGSSAFGNVGLTVQMLDAATNPKLFSATVFFARKGRIKVYGYKPISKTWVVWGPFTQTPALYGLQNATNLSALQFFASDLASEFQVDNISIRGN